MHKTSIFIRTYPKDFPWLIPCLRSIEKYCTGFHEVVVHVDPDQVNRLGSGVPPSVKIVTSPVMHQNGYINQQIAKVQAYQFCSGDYICFHDSDCLFIKPTTPDDLLDGDNPVMVMTPYDQVGDARCWKGPTEKCLRIPVDFEFMRRFPLTYRRDTLIQLDNWFETTGRGKLVNYLARQQVFSEFNAIGAFAFYHKHREYRWINSSREELPILHVRQFWSHGGLEAAIPEINSILSA